MEGWQNLAASACDRMAALASVLLYGRFGRGLTGAALTPGAPAFRLLDRPECLSRPGVAHGDQLEGPSWPSWLGFCSSCLSLLHGLQTLAILHEWRERTRALRPIAWVPQLCSWPDFSTTPAPTPKPRAPAQTRLMVSGGLLFGLRCRLRRSTLMYAASIATLIPSWIPAHRSGLFTGCRVS